MVRITKSSFRTGTVTLLVLLASGTANADAGWTCGYTDLAGLCDRYEGEFGFSQCDCVKKWYSLNCVSNPDVYYCKWTSNLLGCLGNKLIGCRM
jgi:hypothetical protein